MKIIVFGDILWDVFPGKREIGGAAFNFAAHMSKLGADVKMVTAVGMDADGDEALLEAGAFGMDTAGIARVQAPTGRSLVTLKNGIPDYELPFPAAYDCVPLPRDTTGYMNADALYLGTLPSRDPNGVTRASALKLLLEGSYREIFFDINIRKQYYSPDFIDAVLSRTTIFKLSRDEISVLGLSGAADNESVCRAICGRYPGIRTVLLTLDSDGAMAYSSSAGTFVYSEKPSVKVVSTVGGGDSLSACFLYNHLLGEPAQDCLRRASALANFVVGHLGAIPAYTPELTAAVKPPEKQP